MMIDKKTLLENGLLEQYILGELNKEQCVIIEELIISDNEIKEKLKKTESNLESLAFENAIDPPATVKQKLLKSISQSNKNKPITVLKTKSSVKFYLGIAASFAALFLLSSIWLYSELGTIKKEIKIVKSKNSLLKDDLKGITDNFDKTNKWFTALSNPDAEQYILNGNDLAPEAKIVSYINHKDKSVVINTQKLPKLDAKHDYQMWADVDGVMIDMGVISKNKELLAMKYVEHAESLNVTIEPLGGNDHPTVEKLISNVYLE